MEEVQLQLQQYGISTLTANNFVLYWEQHVPILPNVSYEMTYLVGSLSGGRIAYRYKLKEARSIKYSDGIIVLEPSGKTSTKYVEYDFFDANWGLLALSKDRVWKESVQGIYLSGLAIKIKAENPDWSYEKIKEHAKAILGKHPIEETINVPMGTL